VKKTIVTCDKAVSYEEDKSHLARVVVKLWKSCCEMRTCVLFFMNLIEIINNESTQLSINEMI
jgi:hypothetical protein